jgi:hypothetical protein
MIFHGLVRNSDHQPAQLLDVGLLQKKDKSIERSPISHAPQHVGPEKLGEATDLGVVDPSIRI